MVSFRVLQFEREGVLSLCDRTAPYEEIMATDRFTVVWDFIRGWKVQSQQTFPRPRAYFMNGLLIEQDPMHLLYSESRSNIIIMTKFCSVRDLIIR